MRCKHLLNCTKRPHHKRQRQAAGPFTQDAASSGTAMRPPPLRAAEAPRTAEVAPAPRSWDRHYLKSHIDSTL
ncbi:hypothetical protein QQF64_026777 [Cirrhinus molitorella]|uniref:Uncharacterized protein n=1 Tax=Cirrhinus molitorella TaxID=172907 RepID=A0ABR3NAJ1_9TELE